MAVANKPKVEIPKALYAVCVFRRGGEFYNVMDFGFSRRRAKALEGGFNSHAGAELSAELIEVPLLPEQVAAIEAAIEQAIDGELSRGFTSAR